MRALKIVVQHKKLCEKPSTRKKLFGSQKREIQRRAEHDTMKNLYSVRLLHYYRLFYMLNFEFNILK